MKAIAVYPGKPGSVHLREMPPPKLEEIPAGRGVLVKVLRVGVDGTDREILAAEYGAAPAGCDFLVLGHESLGRVEAAGENVREFAPGDYVVASVRRAGAGFYDRIGSQDMTTDDVYYEHGISQVHGFLTEYYVEDATLLVKIPDALAGVGVLLEPLSVAEKGLHQAYEIQRRLKVWRPKRAAVMGAGSIGLLATLLLRLRGFEVVTFARSLKPTLNSELAEAIGAHYESLRARPMAEAAREFGPFDYIFEASSSAKVAFESALALAKNGVLVLTSVTGAGGTHEIPADRINLEFVLGNKVMVGIANAHREDWEMGVRDMAHAEAQYPGWLGRLLTHPVRGLENYQELFARLANPQGAIKIYCQIAD
ncbi:MAG: glucose 1-dehydrogenase [Acidobacteriales bacterium]|nr:glucose 1-dehydrogenase [Terriglobales bacterium]